MTRTHAPPRRMIAIALALAALTGPAVAQPHPGLRYDAIPKSAYAVVAEIRAKPGMEAALREATLPLIDKVRSEPNNLFYVLQEDRETPGRFVFYEIFASQADFDAHNATPHVQAWFARLPELAQGGVNVTRLRILGE